MDKENYNLHETEMNYDKTKHLSGVVCDVKNCAYHCNTNDCGARCISVGPSDATTSANTVCATFKPRTY